MIDYQNYFRSYIIFKILTWKLCSSYGQGARCIAGVIFLYSVGTWFQYSVTLKRNCVHNVELSYR